MALINILAKSEKVINWNVFLKDYSNLNILNIEVFPIPKELGFNCDCVGVNIHQGYTKREIVISEIERLIKFFRLKPYDFKFIELYNGVEVHDSNVIIIIDSLLPVS